MDDAAFKEALFRPQLIARKFGQGTAEEVQRLIVGGRGRERIAWAAAAILDCDTPEEFLARVRED